MKKKLTAILLVIVALFTFLTTTYAGPNSGDPPILPTRIQLPPFEFEE